MKPSDVTIQTKKKIEDKDGKRNPFNPENAESQK